MQRATAYAQEITPSLAEAGTAHSPSQTLTPATSFSGNQAALRRLGKKLPRLQCKLQIGSVDDPLEAEADSVADRIMRMPDPQISLTASPLNLHRKCAACEDEEHKVRTKPDGAPAQGEVPASVHETLRSQGTPLDTPTRTFMESRFGHDFSNVRLHTDSLAAQSAEAVHARAYAAGNHIVLGAGQSNQPTHLLAHELAHIVQKNHAKASPMLHRDPLTVPEMDAKLKAALEAATPDWTTASTVLNGYSPDDMLARLGPLTADQRASIHAAALTGVGPSSRVAQLTDPSFQNTADAHFFTQDNFDNRFEGVVDPTSKTVTLLFRAKFEFLDGIRFGAAQPGAPGWEAETTAGKARFKVDFKSVVESTWSGKGTVKPKCPIGAVNQLQTKVVVTAVESDPHTTYKVSNLGATRSAVSENQGQLDVDDNSTQTKSAQVADPTGKQRIQTNTTQAASAHEFGHSIGLPHVHCPGSDDPCYGVSVEERRDVMGGGDVVQVVQRNGAVKHDDFIPFERIATRWSKDVAGAKPDCNVWTAV